jgi:exodeoxyribonuclease VII large subunit
VDVSRAVDTGLERAAARLERASIRLSGVQPAAVLQAAERRLTGLDWNRRFWESVGRAEGRLEADGRHLHALSPQRTLDRGYAVVTGPDGAVVRSARLLDAGDVVRARLAEGAVTASVLSVDRGGEGAGR